MDKIKIFDNFLTELELKKLLSIICAKNYKYGHSSGYGERVENLFFSSHNEETFFLKDIKKKIEIALSKQFVLDRHYMHIQTFGLDGSYHIDSDMNNSFTFCIYISDVDNSLSEIAGGEFLIKIPNEKFIISIEPISNRAIFFPSTFYHKGLAYNSFFSEKRLCITWKLREIT